MMMTMISIQRINHGGVLSIELVHHVLNLLHGYLNENKQRKCDLLHYYESSGGDNKTTNNIFTYL